MKEKIMSQIKKKEIKMKPKWWFRIQKIGIKGGWILLIIISSVLVRLVWYLIGVINPKELIEFGEIGREVIINDFPYFTLLITISVIILAGFIFAQLENNYKLTRFRIWLSVLFAVSVCSLLLSLIRSFGLI
ncbi:MAG: hypothetical protein Q8P53_03055 [Candidatus Shapirobacteria bacterium]|nr:hypothetical protein [Candidatus Shapirobacteria bacterium]